MDIETVKPQSTPSKIPPKSQIDESKQKILKLKIEIMQIVCATFYPNQQRCILSYIAACSLQEQEVRDDDLAIFQNHQSLIVDLKNGNFVSQYEISEKKKDGKRDKKIICYKLDILRFFNSIGKILKDLQAKLKKINQFYEQSQKHNQEGEKKKMYKRCKGCKTKQNAQLQRFGFLECERCQGTEFEQVQMSDQQKNRIDKLNEIIMIVFGKLKDIKMLQSGLQNQIEINEQKKEVKVSEIDDFMGPYVKYLKERNEYVEIEVSLKTIKEAEKLQAPLREFERVNEMVRAREGRERTREKGIGSGNEGHKIVKLG